MFVAGFIGSPAMNLVRGRLTDGSGRVELVLGGHRLRLPDALLAGRPRLTGRVGEEVVAGIRPEALDLAGTANGHGDAVLELPVTLTEALGSDLLVHAELDAETAAPRDDIDVELEPVRGHSMLTARLSPQAAVAPGRPVRLTVDMERVHFFAPDSGAALR
jgi:multiple sugar transport system ATP-binding protein